MKSKNADLVFPRWRPLTGPLASCAHRWPVQLLLSGPFRHSYLLAASLERSFE